MTSFKNGVKYAYNVKCPVKTKMMLTVHLQFLSFKVASCSFIDNTDVGGTFVKNNEIQAIAITVNTEINTNGARHPYAFPSTRPSGTPSTSDPLIPIK